MASADLTRPLRSYYENKVKIKSEGKNWAKDLVDKYIKGMMLDYFKKNSKLPIRKLEFTGSQYERLKTEVADEVDVMVVMETKKDVTVEEVKEAPGWVRLKVVEGSKYRDYTNTDGYILPEKMRSSWMQSTVQKAKNEIIKENPDLPVTLVIRVHGPAIQLDITEKESGMMLSADLVLSFEFDNDFYVAKPYKVKPNLPPPPTPQLLLRQSFSIAEKGWLRDMDKFDHGCRHILLRIVKTIVSNDTPLKGIFTTYHLKTAFLRLNENRKEKDYWHRDKLGERFVEYIQTLLDALQKRSLPHFWIKGMDLLDGVEEIVCSNMAGRLQRLLTSEKQLYNTLGLDIPCAPTQLAPIMNGAYTSDSCKKGNEDARVDGKQIAAKSVPSLVNTKTSDDLLTLLRKFKNDMGNTLSKELQWCKDTFNTHIKDGVLKNCKEKNLELISKFEYTGNLYENLKTEGRDEDDVTVLVILKRRGNDITHDISTGYSQFKAADGSRYANEFSDVEKFVLPEKLVNWFFTLVRAEAASYEKEPSLLMKVSIPKGYGGVRLEIKEKVAEVASASFAKVYTLIVNLIPSFYDEGEKYFIPRPPLGAEGGPDTRYQWSQSFAMEEKKLIQDMDKDKGCRHDLFKVVTTILKREATFSKLIPHLRILFLMFNREPDRLWDDKKLGDRFTEFLQHLRKILKKGELNHLWHKVNVFTDLKVDTLNNMETRLGRMLSSEQEKAKVLTYSPLKQ